MSIVEWHFHALDIWIAPQNALGLAINSDAAHFTLIRAGVNKALGGKVIHAGTQIIVARAHAVAGGVQCIGARVQPLAHGAPFLPPRLRLGLACAQLFAHLIDFTQRHRAVGRHAFGDEDGVGP